MLKEKVQQPEFKSKMIAKSAFHGISSLKGHEKDYIMYKAITFENGYSISIQANANMYCSPRINASIEVYNEFEMACFDNVGRWLVVLPNEIRWDYDPEKFSKHKKYDYLFMLEDTCAVAGYVDEKLIDKVYQYLKRLPKRQILIEKSLNPYYHEKFLIKH